MEQATERLKKHPLFSGLNEEGIQKIKAIAQAVLYKKGETLFAQGEPSTGFYLVISGKIKVYHLSPQGKEYIMRFVGPGETLAEAAVFSGRTYPASAEAVENSRLYKFNKSDFIGVIKESPQLALNMMSGLSLLLRQLAQQVEDLSLKEVSARLARFLLEEAAGSCPSLSKGMRVPLAIKKNLLASRLGTIQETLSRTLAKMKQRGIIDLDKDGFVIQNPEQLKEIAEGAKL